MKKIKFLSVSVIIVSVIVLGGLAGKQFFSYLETRAGGQLPGSDSAQTNDPSGINPGGKPETSMVLYSSKKEDPANPKGEPVPAAAPASIEASAKPIAEVKASANSANAAHSANPVTTGVASPAVQPSKPAMETVEAVDFQKHKWLAYASGNGTNVRQGPSIEKGVKVVMKVGKGTRGRVLERKDGWTRIQWDFNRKMGWTRDDLLIIGPENVLLGLANKDGGVASATPEEIKKLNKKSIEAVKTVSVTIAKPAPPSQTVRGFLGSGEIPEAGTISASPFANVRSEPNRRSALTGKVPKGVAVKIKGLRKVGRYNWFEIVYNNGRKEGWTREDNLSLPLEAPPKR